MTNPRDAELKRCKCGGEAEIYSHYSGVYECIHGFAQCKKCKRQVWGKVRFDTYEISVSMPGFQEWKRNAYDKVDESIVKAWNEEMTLLCAEKGN